MPPPLRQLALLIELLLRHLALIPETVFLRPEHSKPEALEVVARLGIERFHVAEEELVQQALVELFRMAADGVAADGEDGAGLEADGEGRARVAEVVEEEGKVLRWGFGRGQAFEDALGRGPFGPAGVFVPGDAVPEVEELEDAVRVGGHVAGFGGEGGFFHLEGGERDVVVDAALGEEGDGGEVVVVLDDVVEVGVAFTADVF